ncbi:hypothetical protein L2E82_22321 [Cichorium intybus]|uniref:Uncharacterized protein n=1 Tax=Cichorium intybus TaxID=13427 RepID=A0ACB9DXV6_CICIN|nr:hypothetical protein L2E82_22321 [Cichorium intybus]
MDDFIWSSSTQDAVFDQYSNWDHAPSFQQCSASDHGGGNGGQGGGEWEDGKGSSSKNHSETEKRRRDRINAHLATLRKFVSNSDKMDKATLLGKVVEHVKTLKLETMELSKVFTVPTDLDEVIIDFDSNTDSGNNIFIKASVCCDDRPELFSEIKHAFQSLSLTMVHADMTCLGGRFKCNFIFCVTNNTNENEVTTLRHSLKILLSRIVSTSSWTASSNYRIKSKRQRFFCSSDYHSKDHR